MRAIRPPRRPSLPALLAALLPVLLAASGPLACGRAPAPETEEGSPAATAPRDPAVRAVASLPPLAWLVERIGGERVAVETFISPGASPHAFEPSPRQVVELEEADLVVEVGHPDFAFEQQHLERLVRDREDVELVRLSEGLDLEGEALREIDPHLWVAPERFRAAARQTAEALVRLDPAGEPVYRSNLESLLDEIDRLDREIRQSLGDLPHRSFVVQHPSWGHFAAQYGLHQISIEHQGKEPSPRFLAQLVEEARREGVEVVFVQPGVSTAAAETLAAELGARVVPLDPLARDWLNNLRRVAEALHDSLEDGRREESRSADPVPAAPTAGAADGEGGTA